MIEEIMHVLLIDDEPYPIRPFLDALKEIGAKVTFCSTNSKALYALRSDTLFDVIVQDIMRSPEDLFDAESVEHGLLTGVLFYEQYVKPLRASTPHIFFTNHRGRDLRNRFSGDQQCSFFNKFELTPFDFTEMLYAIVGEDVEIIYSQGELSIEHYPVITSLRDEVKRYFNKNPEKIYSSLSPQAFEELVADILHDLGLDVELTKATRDGGVDIYAHLKHEVGSFLMLVECKKWASDRPVGIDVVQRVYGIQQTKHASKSLIVTTSYFTPPAKSEAAKQNGLVELHDFEALKLWLSKYQ
ncbi:restriction endonuclease [candidate division KSB1 bacterium]